MKKQHNGIFLMVLLLGCLAAFTGLGCSSFATADVDGQGGDISAAAKAANTLTVQVIDKNSELRRVISALGEAIQGDYTPSAEGDCPNLITDPPLDNLSAIPSVMTITIDWGEGCAQDASHFISGDVLAVLTNIQLAESLIAGNFDITANNVVDNGAQIANGRVTGSARAVPGEGGALNVTADMEFTDFLISGYPTTGRVTLQAGNVDINTGVLSNVTVTMTNLNVAGLVTAENCVLTINQTSPTTYIVNITGSTSLGVLDLEADVTNPSAGVYVMSTPRPGFMSGYAVTMQDVAMDLNQCESNPISGTLGITGNGAAYGKTFTGACDGDWNIPGFEGGGGGGGGGGGASSTRWGAFNAVCCNSGSPIAFRASMEGASRTSTSGSCANKSSWEGYASTPSGSGKTVSYNISGCGVESGANWNVDFTFDPDVCHLFTLEWDNELKVRLYRLDSCASPASSAHMGTSAVDRELLDEVTLFGATGVTQIRK